MFVIGLTGGIGTGKTQVSSILVELGASIVNADLLGHEIYKPHTEGWQAVVKAFGEDVLAPDGEVDRRKLGAIVFSDPEALKQLNAIAHPRIYSLAEERIRSLGRDGKDAVVLEAALLIEAKWTPLVDEVWVTTSAEDQVIKRIQERNGLDEESIRSRIRSQMAQSERIEYANAVIDNSGNLEKLREKVEELWNSRVMARKETDVSNDSIN